jgi:hypothetical protein
MDNKQTESVFEQIRESLNLRLVILGLGSFFILQWVTGINIFENVNFKIPHEIEIFTPLIYLILLGVLGTVISVILNLIYNTVRVPLLTDFCRKNLNKMLTYYKYEQLINLYEKREKKAFSIDRKEIKNHIRFYVEDYFIIYLKGKNYTLYKSYVREVSVLMLSRDLLGVSVFLGLLNYCVNLPYLQSISLWLQMPFFVIIIYPIVFISYGLIDNIISNKLLQNIDYITTEENNNV